ncbi:hypothetical protein B0H12DRAFT_1083403 [Mycena haematopus]|nr:hypothetical protein B0H12DRAFT_1083403 [Mycena haematopus]
MVTLGYVGLDRPIRFLKGHNLILPTNNQQVLPPIESLVELQKREQANLAKNQDQTRSGRNWQRPLRCPGINSPFDSSARITEMVKHGAVPGTPAKSTGYIGIDCAAYGFDVGQIAERKRTAARGGMSRGVARGQTKEAGRKSVPRRIESEGLTHLPQSPPTPRADSSVLANGGVGMFGVGSGRGMQDLI